MRLCLPHIPGWPCLLVLAIGLPLQLSNMIELFLDVLELALVVLLLPQALFNSLLVLLERASCCRAALFRREDAALGLGRWRSILDLS